MFRKCQTTTREPIVLIPYVGGLRGSIATTRWTNQSFYQFLGVPYAESPSGSRRFKVKFTKTKLFSIHNENDYF